LENNKKFREKNTQLRRGGKRERFQKKKGMKGGGERDVQGMVGPLHLFSGFQR